MRAIRIVLLDGDAEESKKIIGALDESGIGYTLRTAADEGDLGAALGVGASDVILSAYRFGGMEGVELLARVHAAAPEAAFIFVDDEIGDHTALEALRHGATDCISSKRLSHLPQAVVRAATELAERQRRIEAERQLEREQRISGLGHLVAVITHEFNNVLMGIQPHAEVLRRQRDETTVRAAERILASVARGRQITQDLLRSTNPGKPEIVEVELGAWLRQLEGEIRGVLGLNRRLEVELPHEPVFAPCDPRQMHQVLVNLAVNARDAMRDGGELRITLRQEPRNAAIVVRDDGGGIPADLMGLIFDPLFTTKSHGTGLGLSIVRQLVTLNGGTIEVSSQEGSGTAFTIRLPRRE